MNETNVYINFWAGRVWCVGFAVSQRQQCSSFRYIIYFLFFFFLPKDAHFSFPSVYVVVQIKSAAYTWIYWVDMFHLFFVFILVHSYSLVSFLLFGSGVLIDLSGLAHAIHITGENTMEHRENPKWMRKMKLRGKEHIHSVGCRSTIFHVQRRCPKINWTTLYSYYVFYCSEWTNDNAPVERWLEIS